MSPLKCDNAIMIGRLVFCNLNRLVCYEIARTGQRMATISSNGINLYYEQQGSGPDIVLISGFAAPHLTWLAMLNTLAQHCRVTCFDNRGVGRSDQPEGPYSIAQMADDTIGLMDALGIESALVCGHSMGGMITQYLAAHHANRVSQACIVNSLCHLWPVNLAAMQAMVDIYGSGLDPTLQIRNVLPWLYSNDFLGAPERIQFVLDKMLNDPNPQTPAGYFGQWGAIAQADTREYLAQVHCPVTVVAGSDDILTPPAMSMELANQIDGASYIELEKVGHMIPIEQGAALAEIIKDLHQQ